MFGQLSPPEGLCQRDSHLGVIRAIDSFNVVCSELYKNVVLVAKMTTEMICARVLPACLSAHRMSSTWVCVVVNQKNLSGTIHRTGRPVL
jgi:hypothetical protein